MYFTGFDCLGCRAAYPPDQDLLLCPACHDLLEAVSYTHLTLPTIYSV